MKADIGLKSENEPSKSRRERNDWKRPDSDFFELADEVSPFPWFCERSPYGLAQEDSHFPDLLQEKKEQPLFLRNTHFTLRKPGIPCLQIAHTLG